MFKKIICSVLLLSFSFSFGLDNVDDKFLADGYWMQKDQKTGKNLSIIHIYKNADGKENAQMFVPLSVVEKGKVMPPMIYCENCGKGSAYGNEYDYSSGTERYQGLEFAWNAKEAEECAPGPQGPMYDQGAVLNPYDGQYYHLKAQTIENGNKLYVRAYMGWLGRTEYWERLSEEEAVKIKKMCGLTKKNVYPYQNKNKEIVDQKLFDECSGRDFVKNPC